MEQVFVELVQHAGSKGFLPLLQICYRELRDWPMALLIAYREYLQQSYWFMEWNDQLTQIARRIMSEGNPSPTLQLRSNREIVLTSLPLFLFSLGVTLASLVGGKPWISLPTWRFVLSIVVGLLPMAAIGIVAFYGLLQRQPDWSWTWIGTAYMGVSLFVKTASEEQAEVGRYILSAIGDVVIVIAVLLTGAVLITMAAFKGWRRAGLFSIGAAGTLALSFCMAITVAPFHRHDLALFAAPIGLLQALLLYTYVRGTDQGRIAAILGIGVINAGIALLASRVWQEWLANQGRPSPLLALLVIMSIVLISGPVWAWMTKSIQTRFKPT